MPSPQSQREYATIFPGQVVSGTVQMVVDANDVAQPISTVLPMPVSITGGATTLSDVVLTDDSGAFFIARDSGSALTYINLSGGAYTPTTNIKPAYVSQGTAATGITIPTGGVGQYGWLSGIYDRLSKIVLATGTALIGKVGIDQTTPGTTNAVVASGKSYQSPLSIARPSDTNAYTGGDVIGPSTSAGGAVLTLANIGAASGGIIITDTSLCVEVAAIPSGMTSFILHLYNASPASNLGDNAPWVLGSADIASYLGFVLLGAPVVLGSYLYIRQSGINLKVTMPAGTLLYAYLQTVGGYTPTSGAVKLLDVEAIGV